MDAGRLLHLRLSSSPPPPKKRTWSSVRCSGRSIPATDGQVRSPFLTALHRARATINFFDSRLPLPRPDLLLFGGLLLPSRTDIGKLAGGLGMLPSQKTCQPKDLPATTRVQLQTLLLRWAKPHTTTYNLCSAPQVWALDSAGVKGGQRCGPAGGGIVLLSCRVRRGRSEMNSVLVIQTHRKKRWRPKASRTFTPTGRGGVLFVFKQDQTRQTRYVFLFIS